MARRVLGGSGIRRTGRDGVVGGAIRRAGGATRNMRDALRCANCWWTSLQHAAGFGMGIASGTWITVYLLREFGLPLELSGLLGSLLLVLAVLARPLGGCCSRASTCRRAA